MCKKREKERSKEWGHKRLSLQGPVEDGLVHVDIALPDYKLALFLENALEPSQGKAVNSYTRQSDGTTLNG